MVLDGCPYELIDPAAWDMITAYNDWESGHNPVTTGRAPWLPSVYVDAVRAVAGTVRRCNDDARRRAESKAKSDAWLTRSRA